jgi:serine/threonine protein kinase/Flp pilus assembly protein TadD
VNKELPAGSTLSHYRIVSRIGAGGMGEVYLAHDTKLDRKVAIKFLHEEFSKDADKLNRFIQEAKAASALNHANILTVYEIGEVDGKNYIATELIDGKTLREHLSHKESLQLNQILKIGVQVSEALSAAHQAGIIHRDIKPENIMLRKDGNAKVLDFGLAKLTEKKAAASGAEGSEDATRVRVNTSPGLVMGTVSYMSPEQARGKETDVRTDIWSLGVVLYEMLSGKVPFTGETVNHTIVSILEKEPLLLENVPAELQRIVRKSMAKDVDMRYQSARDLLIDLKNLRRDLDIQGELERSIIPNREAANTSLENATQMYPAGSVAATRSGEASATQSVTTSSSSLEYAVNQAKSHKLVSAMIGVLLVGTISIVGYFAFVSRGGSTKQISSIAVMPFVNESGNADVEYLSDGMTETLINSLSQMPNLSVKARSSVFRYKGRESDLRTVGKELGVQAILNGRLVMRGDRLTLNVELIDAQTENTIWGNRYERTLSDLVKLQSDVAHDVSGHLKSKLSGSEEAKVTKSYTTNPKALELYLKGRYLSRQFTLDGFRKGVEAFNQAIAIDQKYALAYAGLSDAYFYASTIHLPPTEALPKVGEYARRALEADDSLAAAHHSMANYKANYERDNIGAKREFERALELDPNDSSIYFDYSQLLANIGESEQAIALAQRAKLIDPQDSYVSYTLAQAFILAGRYDEGLRETGTTISLDDRNWWGYYWRGVAYSAKGMHDEAIAALQTAAGIDDSPLIRGVLACSLARAGRRTDAQHIIDELILASKSKFVSQSSIAMGYGGLGEKDKAFEWLDKSLESHDEAILWIYKHPMFSPLRDDQRFQELLKKLNLAK